jgi:hypothetical protein
LPFAFCLLPFAFLFLPSIYARPVLAKLVRHRSPRTLALLGAPAIGVATFLSGAVVEAAGLPPLVVHRTDDSADCPDTHALAGLVARQMKRPALEPAVEAPPGRGLDVQIYRSQAGYTAVVQAGGKTRSLSDQGPTCGGLAAALAVSIAVMLDTEPLPPEPEPPPRPEPERVALPPLPPLEPPPAPSPAATARATGPEPLTEVHRFKVMLTAGGAITDGLLRPLAGGVTGELEFRFGRFSVAGGVLSLPGQSVDFGAGQVNLSLTAGFIRGCGTVLGDGDALRFALCLEPFGGTIRGEGQGYTPNRSSTLAWAAAGASALFQQRIWGPFAWGARAQLLIPLLKESFFVDNVGAAFTPAPVGGALDAELRVSIW